MRYARWLLLPLLLAGCREAARRVFTPPDVRFAGASVSSLGLDGGTLDVTLVVRNRNPYALTANGANYRLLAGDSAEVGRGSTVQPVTVAANDSAQVVLPVELSWRALERVGRSALRSGEIDYRVVGEIEVGTPVGARTVPVDARGRARAPRLGR